MKTSSILHIESSRAYFDGMSWIKTLLVDLIVTTVILIAVVTDLEAARWAVLIYTPFMLLLKVISLAGGSFTRQFKPKSPEAPAWAYHLLYGINVAALAIAQWWILVAQWAAIWIISYIQFRKASPSTAQSQQAS